MRPHGQQDKHQVDGEQGPQHSALSSQVKLAEHGAEVDHVGGEAETQGADYFSGVSTNTLDLARAVHSHHLSAGREEEIDGLMDKSQCMERGRDTWINLSAGRVEEINGLMNKYLSYNQASETR